MGGWHVCGTISCVSCSGDPDQLHGTMCDFWTIQLGVSFCAKLVVAISSSIACCWNILHRWRAQKHPMRPRHKSGVTYQFCKRCAVLESSENVLRPTAYMSSIPRFSHLSMLLSGLAIRECRQKLRNGQMAIISGMREPG